MAVAYVALLMIFLSGCLVMWVLMTGSFWLIWFAVLVFLFVMSFVN